MPLVRGESLTPPQGWGVGLGHRGCRLSLSQGQGGSRAQAWVPSPHRWVKLDHGLIFSGKLKEAPERFRPTLLVVSSSRKSLWGALGREYPISQSGCTWTGFWNISFPVLTEAEPSGAEFPRGIYTAAAVGAGRGGLHGASGMTDLLTCFCFLTTCLMKNVFSLEKHVLNTYDVISLCQPGHLPPWCLLLSSPDRHSKSSY